MAKRDNKALGLGVVENEPHLYSIADEARGPLLVDLDASSGHGAWGGPVGSMPERCYTKA